MAINSIIETSQKIVLFLLLVDDINSNLPIILDLANITIYKLNYSKSEWCS